MSRDRDHRANQLRQGVARPNTLGGGVPGTRSGPAQPRPAQASSRAARDAFDRPESFGPNGVAVSRMLRRLAQLEQPEARALVSFWRAVPEGARHRAHEAAQDVAGSSGRRDQARRAQEAAFPWLASASDAAIKWMPHGDVAASVRDWAQLRRDAFPAVLDALAATVLADLLDPLTVEMLSGPWDAATGTAETTVAETTVAETHGESGSPGSAGPRLGREGDGPR